MSTVIKVENLSKQYRLGEVGTGTLSHDLKRWWHKVQGKEDPFLKIGEANDRTAKGSSDYVWALRDIDFEVKQGEVLGIIGRNGAGKSTLLKILSKTTKPTTGSIKINGRIASLLEVGTGFHPELTGRENIFLNGAILGMTKREIKSKFDEIVDFAGVERYIDTPVKRYSSGMYVRLAFAVAAHLEPEILIVDEVLAVGDAEFQKKCLGKMKDVSVNQGRTVLFVSHNMAAMQNLCNTGLLLQNGHKVAFAVINKVIHEYQLTSSVSEPNILDFDRKGLGDCRITRIEIATHSAIDISNIRLGDNITIKILIKNMTNSPLKSMRVIIGIYNYNEEGFLRFDTAVTNSKLDFGEMYNTVICTLSEAINIRPDNYFMNIAIMKDNELIDYVVRGKSFEIENFDYYGTGRNLINPELSKVFYKHSWIIQKDNYEIN